MDSFTSLEFFEVGGEEVASAFFSEPRHTKDVDGNDTITRQLTDQDTRVNGYPAHCIIA
jgi:hypothetical protein